MLITFSVPGKPQTAGSKRAFPYRKKTGGLGVRVTDDNKHTKTWQGEIRAAAMEVYDAQLMRGPIKFTATFIFARPKSHYRTGKFSDMLKDSAPQNHITKPDVLKLCRAVEDALTGVVWRDDSQVVIELLHKQYGEPERMVVEIEELDGTCAMASIVNEMEGEQ